MQLSMPRPPSNALGASLFRRSTPGSYLLSGGGSLKTLRVVAVGAPVTIFVLPLLGRILATALDDETLQIH